MRKADPVFFLSFIFFKVKPNEDSLTWITLRHQFIVLMTVVGVD